MLSLLFRYWLAERKYKSVAFRGIPAGNQCTFRKPHEVLEFFGLCLDRSLCAGLRALVSQSFSCCAPTADGDVAGEGSQAA